MSAFRTHGRGHLNGPVVVVGTGLLGTSIGLGLRGRGVAVFLSDPSPTNQAVAVDIGAGLPLARLDGEQPELVVVAAPPDVTADVVQRALADYPGATVVDIASGKIRSTVKVGKEPEGVRVAPDGKTVWVTGETDHNVTVIDTKTGAVVGQVEVGKRRAPSPSRPTGRAPT